MNDYTKNLQDLKEDLLNYITTRRWYGNKANLTTGLDIIDAFQIEDFILAILSVEGASRLMYYVPLFMSKDEFSGRIGSFTDEGIKINVYDAFYFENFAKVIMRNMEHNALLKKNNSYIQFHRTNFFQLNEENTFSVINTEQSNSSFIIGNTIIKNYRYLQFGENPDITMSMKLKENGFTHVPSLKGYMKYVSADGIIYLCSAMEYFPKSVDLWSYYNNFKVDKGSFKSKILNLASDMGTLTGEMCRTLASIKDEDFRPEKMAVSELEEVIDDSFNYLDVSREIMNKRHMELGPFSRDINKEKLKAMFTSLFSNEALMKTRVHGDYHLGQILLYRNRYYIIDFEGEPARSMLERTSRKSPFKDVSGILRSIDYLCSGVDEGMENISSEIISSFLRNYLKIIGDMNLIPTDNEKVSRLLQLFLLQKASYELLYEINNRPSWIHIPLKALKEILESLNVT